MKQHRPITVGSQDGMVLVVSLIMLLVLSLIGINSMRSANLEERMAGNMKQQQRSFQAAELALRTAEQAIINGAAEAMANAEVNCADTVDENLTEDDYTELGANSLGTDELAPEIHARYCEAQTREYQDSSGTKPCSDAGGQSCIFVNYHPVIGAGRIPGNAETVLKSTFAVMF